MFSLVFCPFVHAKECNFARINKNCLINNETVNVIAKVAFKMFLGISGTVTCVNKESNIFSIIFDNNPLSDFVELPKSLSSLNYCSLLCGVIKGALEQIRIKVNCYFVKDMLKGDDYYELYIQLNEVMKEEILNDEES
ncbi:hypothetical protein PFTANZ_06662 [Plasmodium falciparum Tanzania (2000708)]|uniref:Trafficking protein particle complex subunit n=1 Tax=Plasmodium falciparum Tanzania (2000708) TaxID=1036725 RepID=A0A024VXG4_PLAFA|nr:hypothetical protein PFTANZ_06662 [Plasmodium falciparum Tanzania (2000708)]